MCFLEFEPHSTHNTQPAARKPPSRFAQVVRDPPVCYYPRLLAAAHTMCCCCTTSMPKRPLDDSDITLEPETNDVPPTTAMLYANILRALFISAARIARDNQHVHDPIVVRRLLRGAARIEAWRSGSPVTADRFPPPQISPATSPADSSPIGGDDPDADDGILAFQAMLSCPRCPGCGQGPWGCWEQLSHEEQKRRRIRGIMDFNEQA